MEIKSRLYPIRSCRSFHAGVTYDGRQVLMGLYAPSIVAVFFDSDGNFVTTEERPIEVPSLPDRPKSYAIHDPDFETRLKTAVGSWRNELNFTSDLIRVKSFRVEGRFIGITDYPEYMAATPPGQVGDRLRKQIDRWNSSELFVLSWAKEFWMSKDGEVHST